MTRLHRISLSGATLALGAVLVSSPALAQQPAPSPAPAASQQQAPAASMVEGELMSVDATAKQLVVKTAAGQEEQIRYTDSTKVTGGQSGVAGLANARGTQVSVTVTGSGADRVASEIMIKEKS
ncbi:MAG: hypothetical protein R2712_17950 [Vicinamibacterales bacterium]